MVKPKKTKPEEKSNSTKNEEDLKNQVLQLENDVKQLKTDSDKTFGKFRKLIDRNAQISDKNLFDSNKILDQAIDSIEKGNDLLKQFKENIISFTLQLISILVGIFALIISIMFLWVNGETIDSKWLFFYLAVAVFFTVIFSIFVYFWIRKNFPKKRRISIEIPSNSRRSFMNTFWRTSDIVIAGAIGGAFSFFGGKYLELSNETNFNALILVTIISIIFVFSYSLVRYFVDR